MQRQSLFPAAPNKPFARTARQLAFRSQVALELFCMGERIKRRNQNLRSQSRRIHKSVFFLTCPREEMDFKTVKFRHRHL